mmetsp:Transcript_72437/g.193124  ORF Transcript_72437/g.193124 Transcript_72437/m.193124 type:complete len:229 (-) Transcript_72437:1436-2122(-)
MTRFVQAARAAMHATESNRFAAAALSACWAPARTQLFQATKMTRRRASTAERAIRMDKQLLAWSRCSRKRAATDSADSRLLSKYKSSTAAIQAYHIFWTECRPALCRFLSKSCRCNDLFSFRFALAAACSRSRAARKLPSRAASAHWRQALRNTTPLRRRPTTCALRSYSRSILASDSSSPTFLLASQAMRNCRACQDRKQIRCKVVSSRATRFSCTPRICATQSDRS